MGDRYVKSDVNKKILFFDAINVYGHSMSQPLPFDEIEMWHGHPDPYMKELQEILNSRDDSDIGYFIQVDLRYTDDIKKERRNFHFVLKIKLILKINIMKI